MIKEITSAFDKEVDKLPLASQVRDWLKHHERKEIALRGLIEQIKICEVKLGSFRFDVAKYHAVTESFVKTFATLALRHAEDIAVSALERQRLIDDANRIDNIKEKIAAEIEEDSNASPA